MLNNCHFSQLIHQQAAQYGSKTALSYRDYDQNKWIPISWTEFSEKVSAVSRALLALGTSVQENLGIFSQNKPESLMVDFGAYGVRAVTIPFYATSSAAQVQYMVNDAEVRLLFVGEQLQYDTARRVLPVCPTLERMIIFDRKVVKHENDHLSLYFDEFLALADSRYQEEVDKRSAVQKFDELANILYTSGTTGDSKGVMITHEMYHAGLAANDAVLPLSEKDVFLNFLPFTHIFERAWTYLGLAEGAEMAVNLVPQDVLQSMREVHPTCMSAVPRFWEKVYHGVLEKIEKGSFIERRLIKEALEVGKRYSRYKAAGKHVPLSLSLSYRFYESTVIKLLRKTLGLERANFFPTAGAAVPPVVEEFVHATGINMVVGYGLTESTATVSCDILGMPYTVGSVGRLIEGLELRIGDNEEILLRGKTITPGYYKKESITRHAIDKDGWFHTGDAGYMKNGELFLKERIKDLFKTSNGKYIAPQMIETKLVVDRLFEQAVIIADKRKFVSALIVPNYQLLEEYVHLRGMSFKSREEMCAHPAVYALIETRINTLQQDLANYERIKRFIILPQPFSVENGELTNTLKVKRAVVYQHYAEKIQKLYDDAEKEAVKEIDPNSIHLI